MLRIPIILGFDSLSFIKNKPLWTNVISHNFIPYVYLK